MNKPNIRFQKEHYFKAQKNIIAGIAIDLLLPANFNNLPNTERDLTELQEWWDRPFIVTQGWSEEPYEKYKKRLMDYADGDEILSEEEYLRDIADSKISWYKS